MELDENNVVVTFPLALVSLNIDNGSDSKYIALRVAMESLKAVSSAGIITNVFLL